MSAPTIPVRHLEQVFTEIAAAQRAYNESWHPACLYRLQALQDEARAMIESATGVAGSYFWSEFMSEEKRIACPPCSGLGEWDEGPLPATSPVQESPDYLQVKCDDCGGEGSLWSDRTTEELRGQWKGLAA